MATRRMSRAAAVFVATSVALTGMFAGTANAATVSDSFEFDSPTVFGPGATRNCTRAHTGSCSVLLNPPCCSSNVVATSPVDLPIQGTTTVSFHFMGESTGGNVDSNVIVVLDTGKRVILHTTDGFNNGVSLMADGVNGRVLFGSWPTANVWHQMRIAFNPVNNVVTATVGQNSGSMTIAPASKIMSVEFWGVRWGSGTPLRYDSLAVQNTPPLINGGPATGLQAPVDNATLPYAGPHDFTVKGVDLEGDSYSTTVTIRDAATGTPVRTLQSTGITPNNTPVTLRAEPKLPPGEYTWSARSTDSRGALGPVSASTFTFKVAHLAYRDGRFVALGDSYSSGEGVPPFLAGTDNDVEGDERNMCHRSPRAYSGVLAGSDIVPTRYEFYACSGAETRNLVDGDVFESMYREPAQFSHLGADVTLVTMSIGGNDSGFADVLQYCATHGDCHESQDDYVQKRFSRLMGAVYPPSDPDYEELNSIIPLSEVYYELRHAAPNARVVIVGYPKFFSLTEGNGCYMMNPGEQEWMNNKVAQLNTMIKERVRQAGFEYADVENAFDGHHLCTSDDPWMHGVVGAWTPGTKFVSPYSFHPNGSGHAAFAEAVRATLTGTPASRTTHVVKPRQSAWRSFIVGPMRPSFTSVLKWPGSDIELRLVSPSGRRIDRETVAPDVTRDAGPTFDIVTVTDPEPGAWTLEMYGADVPLSGEEATLDVYESEPVNAGPVASASVSLARNTVTVDGSASSDPDGTITRYRWDFDDGTVATGATATHRYAAPGTYRVTLTVYDDRGGSAFRVVPVEVTPYQFTGFAAPVNNAPTLNRMNAGRTVPVKWHLADGGTPVADPASFVSVTSVAVPCDAAATVDVVEEVGTSNAGLQYAGDGNWSYTWATDKAWAGTCRRMTLRLADGAAGRTAMFDFR